MMAARAKLSWSVGITTIPRLESENEEVVMFVNPEPLPLIAMGLFATEI